MPLQYNIIFLKKTPNNMNILIMCKLRFYALKCYVHNLLAVHLQQLIKEYPSLKVWTRNINSPVKTDFIFEEGTLSRLLSLCRSDHAYKDNGAIFDCVIFFLFKLKEGDPLVSFSSCQRNLIKTFQIEAMIALITKMVLIFSWDLLNGQK